MSQVILNKLPSTIIDKEINFSNSLKNTDKDVLIEVLEYIEDYLYVSDRENDKNISKKIRYIEQIEFFRK